VAKKSPFVKEATTLSGFKNLKTLAVLDIDTLDLVPELRSCIRNSAGSLSKLKLSFSEKLASLARSPSVDPDPEDSVSEDDFQPLPPPPQNDDASGPAKVFRAQEEKKAQESALGRIFDTEPLLDIRSRRNRENDKGKPEVKDTKGELPIKSDDDFVSRIKTYVSKLLPEVNGTGNLAASQEVLDAIGLAAQKYLDEIKPTKENEQETPNDTNASSSSANPSSDTTATEESADTNESGVSLFSQPTAPGKAKAAQKDVSPEDIDIEEPEGELSIDPQDPPGSDSPVDEAAATSSEPSSSAAAGVGHAKAEYGKAMANLVAQKANYKELSAKLDEFEAYARQLDREIQRIHANSATVDLKSLVEAESQMLSFNRSIQDMQREISILEAEIEFAERIQPTTTDRDKLHAHIQRMGEYLRKTRGMALESLSIYLIPVKASVLSRAVDLRVLRRLTLLNVGIQNPVWALLHKENKEAPLALRKIFTDHVTPIFLNFVSALQEVHELFMLEREVKYKPESFAPRTEVTIDQIRKMALKRHMGTLRRLMIKNLADTAWDVNEKTVLLLCRHGRKLEELACNMSVRAMVCFSSTSEAVCSLFSLSIRH
jgi:hypothetical protein